MPNILDRDFKYTPSSKTDIRKTFAKARRAQETQKAADAAAIKPAQMFQYRRGAK